MIDISKYLDPRLITFMEVSSSEDAIKTLVETIDATGKLQDPLAFYDAIMEREKIVSTGIGMGTAIPHAKITTSEDFFIAIGILAEGIEWNSLDGIPVRIIFMIGGPDNKQTQYLQVLSSLTHIIKNESLRKKMLTLKSTEEIIKVIKEFYQSE